MTKDLIGGCCCGNVAFKLKDDFQSSSFVIVNSAES